VERRLAAIFATDVVGYSRLMEADEAGTLAALKSHRSELIDPQIAEHHGRIVKLMGDGALVEFASVVDAVACAVAVRDGMVARNEGVPDNQRIEFRIGIHLGDVMIEDDDLYGDGVNMAARLEGLAAPGGICISQQALDQVETKLDLTYEDMGEQQVKNISRPIRTFRVLSESAIDGPDRKQGTARRWPAVAAVATIVVAALVALVWWQPWIGETDWVLVERPTDLPAIAVLPFDNTSGDPDQEYFSDGLTEDLIIDLSRISGLFVIARNSVFTYKGTPVNVQQVGRDLGVKYVLEGSVRRVGSRVRINSQLVDAQTGRHIWADRYDREMTDVFALQDEVVQKIVAALAVKLTLGEEEQLSQAAKVDPEAYDMLLRGLEQLRRYTRETNVEAREYFEKAIALNPDYARAHANLAFTYAMDALYRWGDAPDQAIVRGLEIASGALDLDASVRQAHFTLGNIYLSDKRHEQSIAASRRALELDPNYADAYAQLAITLNYAGRPEEGLEAIRNAIRLDPRQPFVYVRIKGQAHYLMGHYEAAIKEFERVVERNPAAYGGRLWLAAAYAQVGRIGDAEWEAQEILALFPGFTLARMRQREPYKDPAHLDRYVENLRKAGLPE
jgi:adenylate cyclase